MFEDEIDSKILKYCRQADVVELSSKTGLKPNEVMEYIDMIKHNKEFRKLISVMFPLNFKWNHSIMTQSLNIYWKIIK